MRVLVVEDDVKLARSLQRGLELAGYDVAVAHDGVEGFSHASTSDFDAVVLDVMLPGMDGFEVCEALRAREIWTPVLMLTARTEVTDRVRGLDGGADDYVPKPFDFDELRARLRVLVRRGPAHRRSSLEVGALHLDPSTRMVSRAGHHVELTGREFDVLAALMRSPGTPVSRATLLAQVWPNDPHVSPNIVDVYIGQLRKKLGRSHGPQLIRTIRGRGFLLESP